MEDRTPFEAITMQFGLLEEEVRKIMKAKLKFSSYKNWCHRVESCRTKRVEGIDRFKSAMQRQITGNRLSKR